jgi:hypothetical protein
MSDLEYPSPIWVARHSKAVGSFLIVLGVVVVAAGYFVDANTFLFGAFVGGFLIILGVWIIDAKRITKDLPSFVSWSHRTKA